MRKLLSFILISFLAVFVFPSSALADGRVFYEADKDDDIPSGHINKMGAAIRFARLESN